MISHVHRSTLHWRHNDHDSVSNHQPHGCLLNRLFRRRSKETSKLRVTGLCVGNSPGPVNSPHKGPVTRKMFPFDDVIMNVTDMTWLRLTNDSILYSHISGPGTRLIIKTVFPGIGIPMLRIRRSRNRLILNMGIPILVRRHLYVEAAPWYIWF